MNLRLKPKTCATCGVGFIGGPTATYCPTCRAERIRQHDRERHQRKLAGQLRHIGSTDLCLICGKSYEVVGGNQKYCEPCSVAKTKRHAHELWLAEYYDDPVKRQKYLQRARQWAESHKDRMAEILRKSYKRHLDDIKDKRRKMYGVKLRPLGRTEICPKCGNEFIVCERNQKYCPTCK
jgi:rubrerythrin